jgi:hypothetical protein
MKQIEITWDSRDLEVLRNAGVERALERALSKAGGDAVRFLKSGSSRLIRARKRFRVKRVNDSLPLRFPKSKAIESLAWRMDISGRPVPLSDFPHRQTKKGVTVAVNAGSRGFIKSAFVATMRSGHKGIFTRRGEKRLPIDEAFTTRVSDVFSDSGFVEFVQRGAQEKFARSFDRLFPLELARGGR